MSLILTINAGSSSLRFALFDGDAALTRVLGGKIERIGLADSQLEIDRPGGKTEHRPIDAPDHAACVSALEGMLRDELKGRVIEAITHRIVHGGPHYREPVEVTDEVVRQLTETIPFAPQHLPGALAIITEMRRTWPQVTQVACFDTEFHRHLPRVASLLPIPRKYDEMGVRRYGFHGLSYSYLMEELHRLAGAKVANGRVILAHLGNGASMAAVLNGVGIDTTMGFTPAAGLVMSNRPGDIDPGIVAFLNHREGMSAADFEKMVNTRCGLLGVSETSPDIRDLLSREADDVRAAEALNLFCYSAKKAIGALSAALGGLQTLVFAGGIGEHAAVIRSRICNGLEFLGVFIDPKRNSANEAIVSSDESAVTIRVIPTDEELFMARTVVKMLTNRRATKKDLGHDPTSE